MMNEKSIKAPDAMSRVVTTAVAPPGLVAVAVGAGVAVAGGAGVAVVAVGAGVDKQRLKDELYQALSTSSLGCQGAVHK